MIKLSHGKGKEKHRERTFEEWYSKLFHFSTEDKPEQTEYYRQLFTDLKSAWDAGYQEGCYYQKGLIIKKALKVD